MHTKLPVSFENASSITNTFQDSRSKLLSKLLSNLREFKRRCDYCDIFCCDSINGLPVCFLLPVCSVLRSACPAKATVLRGCYWINNTRDIPSIICLVHLPNNFVCQSRHLTPVDYININELQIIAKLKSTALKRYLLMIAIER